MSTTTEDIMKESKMAESNRYHKRPVICIETQQIFPSIYEASKWLGGNIQQNESNIWLCCTGKEYRNRKHYYGKKTCKGYHWKFKEVKNG